MSTDLLYADDTLLLGGSAVQVEELAKAVEAAGASFRKAKPLLAQTNRNAASIAVRAVHGLRAALDVAVDGETLYLTSRP